MNSTVLLVVPFFFLVLVAMVTAGAFPWGTEVFVGMVVAVTAILIGASIPFANSYGMASAAKFGFFIAIWGFPSIVALPGFVSIPYFGIILWFVLSAVFFIGATQNIGTGGAGT